MKEIFSSWHKNGLYTKKGHRLTEIKRGEVTQVKKVNGKEKYRQEYIPELSQNRYVNKRKACHRPCKFQ